MPLGRQVEIEDLNDVGVPQRRGHLGLAPKALEDLLAAAHLGQQDLDGVAAGEAGVAGLVDLPHSTGPDQADDAIGIGEQGARCKTACHRA
jgi:hypothetical protein